MEEKLTLYPKTKRVGSTRTGTEITEKLDGSNLGFFKLEGSLWIAQRNNVIPFSYIFDSSKTYKGLKGFMEENGEHLQADLQESACIFGEWIGMGRLKYGEDFGKFHQFAKCNVEQGVTISLKNIYYDRELFKWSFFTQEQPEYIQTVPLIATLDTPPTKEQLDESYDWYYKQVQRDVEGFIVNTNNSITKYVRMKNGTLKEHTA